MTNQKLFIALILILVVVVMYLIFQNNQLSKSTATWETSYNASERTKDSLRAIIDSSDIRIAHLDHLIDSAKALQPTFITKHHYITKRYEKDYSVLDTAGRAYYIEFWAIRLNRTR